MPGVVVAPARRDKTRKAPTVTTAGVETAKSGPRCSKIPSILFALGFAILGCRAAGEPPAVAVDEPPAAPVDAPIQVDRTQYAFENGPYGPEIRIAATFTAPADQTVYLVNCNGAITTGLQRLVGDRWIDAWIATTNSCLSPPIEIPPRGVRTEKIVVAPGPVIYPANATQLESGTYRAVFHNALTSFDPNARPFGPDLPLEERVSAPFTVAAPRTAG